MRTILLFLFVTMLSTGILLGALSMKSSVIPSLGVIGLWCLFIWYLSSRSNKRAKQKQRERLFDEWLYQQNRNRGQFR